MNSRRVTRWTFVGCASALLATSAVVGPFLTGCSQDRKRKFGEWLNRDNPHHQVVVALESDSADRRREAVNRLARSKKLTAGWAFEALDTIARTDRNESVRCAAVRAMKAYFDDRPVGTLLMILEQPAYQDKVRPASSRLRWDAIQVLDDLHRRVLVPPEQQNEVLEVLLSALHDDRDRNVRLAAAEALGECADERAVRGLIEAMRTRDFGVAYTCEQSLIRLTGVTNDYRADQWASWLEQTGNPFEHAGEVPDELRRPRRSWWDRTWQFMRGMAIAWQGESKESP